MLVILLVPVIAALLVAGLISAVSGTSFGNAVGLLLVLVVVLAVWVGGRKLLLALGRWQPTGGRDADLRLPVDSTQQVSGTSRLARHAMDAAQEQAVAQQEAFRRTLEKVGAGLDDVQRQHGATGTSAGEFTGSQDIPALMAAFARDNVKNVGTILLTLQQAAGRRLVENVAYGVAPPEDLDYPAQRRSLPAREDDGDD